MKQGRPISNQLSQHAQHDTTGGSNQLHATSSLYVYQDTGVSPCSSSRPCIAAGPAGPLPSSIVHHDTCPLNPNRETACTQHMVRRPHHVSPKVATPKPFKTPATLPAANIHQQQEPRAPRPRVNRTGFVLNRIHTQSSCMAPRMARATAPTVPHCTQKQLLPAQVLQQYAAQLPVENACCCEGWQISTPNLAPASPAATHSYSRHQPWWGRQSPPP